MDSGPLSHTYQLTRLDLAEMSVSQMFRSRYNFYFLLGMTVTVATTCTTIFGFSDEWSMLALLVEWLRVAAQFLLTVIPVLILIRVLRAFVLRQKGVVGTHTLTITELGLVEKTAYNETLHRWMTLLQVRMSRRCVLIFVKPGLVHAVPIRSFASAEEMKKFVDEIKYRSMLQ
ncbi:MAG: YcxB family protein [Planctomycetota bacterium]|nr:YcxB family protein [Planctomycetota bacterium]